MARARRKAANNPQTTTEIPPIITLVQFQEIQKLIGTEGADNLYDQLDYIREDNTVSDRLVGGGGNDTIRSAGGRDTISAGAGDDIINTSGGAVFVDGGAGFDRVRATFERTSVGLTANGEIGSGKTLTLSDGSSFANVEALSINLSQANDVVALRGDVALFGGSGDDILSLLGGVGGKLDGGVGNDVLNGGSGNDRLEGGFGSDVIKGGAGDDILLGGGLLGDNAADRLDGGAGNDYLDGGVGNDTLTGGTGGDAFAITAGTNGIDRVLDFSFAEGDRLDQFFQILPPNFDSAFPETATLVTDPLGQGFLKLSQTAEGVLVSLVSDPTSGLLLIGANEADVSSAWFI